MSDIFPKDRNFTVDELVAQGHDRKSIVLALQKMDTQGLGKFIIGRRGAKSRFEWANTMSVPVTNRTPAPSTPIVPKAQTPSNPAGGFAALMARIKGTEPSVPQSEPEIKVEEEEQPLVPVSKSKKERDPFLVIRDLREGVSQIEAQLSPQEILRAIANAAGFKISGPVSFEALQEFLENQRAEVLKLREGATWEEPPGLEHVPYEWISEQPMSNGLTHVGWGFWSPEQREAIAKELRTWRRGK